ncbi:MAG TPA: DUF4190 domain-containing protein [Anaerolineales bacterium]|nr:DUF4190 domain-containing protein [Anaerolineales bacterium]
MDQPNLPPAMGELELPSSTLAIVSLVSGLLGFTVVPIVGGIVALITGYMARNETRSLPPRASGDGLATAGIIMGWVQIGLLVLGVCCAIAGFFFFVVMAGASVQ